MKRLFPIFLFFISMSINICHSQTIGFKGQLSSWITTKPGESFRSQIGGRYIPELSFSKTIKDKYNLDAELSLNLYGYALINSFDDVIWDGEISPYRIWVRFTAPRYEIRAGLQKISFGPSTLLRPLMWFDQIDPRDPLQLTDGVYSLLGRYYFLNNANIWLWFLYGNDQQKGWEVIPSYRNKPEYGGRIQLPFLKGEIAMSYHYRTANLAGSLPPGFEPDSLINSNIPENRLGFDGKWDVGIGLWFEGSFIHQDIEIPLLRSKKLINTGADYTIGIGNGLTIMAEQFWFDTSEKMFETGNSMTFTALSANYPVGIIDNLSVIVFYDWENNSIYNFINWGMRWDKISLYVMGFWNPENYELYQNITNDQNLYAGKGIMVQFVFNH